MKIAIIGGGAAGFFAAIQAKTNHPDSNVTIFEKTQKLLSKVKISGGGRCNVTNGCTSISELLKAYPRGGKHLKKLFYQFNTKHTMEWFEARGVPLKIEDDGRVFPTTNQSQTIIDCLINEVNNLKIRIEISRIVSKILSQVNQLELKFKDHKSELFDKVIIASGGSPKLTNFLWLEELGHKIEVPVPSLFTFNMPEESITELMGIVAEPVSVKIQGANLKSEGPLLITHWGMSGPAILKLSSFGARILNEMDYEFNIQVNWLNEYNHEKIYQRIEQFAQSNSNKTLSKMKPFSLPQRLWLFLTEKIELNEQQNWGELGKKSFNKLVNLLTNDVYRVSGKTTFKEEFVTCGGVSLESVDMKTMQSKVCKNLYFAGEVLDIDAITGGYNFQAAWTTGFVAGQLQS